MKKDCRCTAEHACLSPTVIAPTICKTVIFSMRFLVPLIAGLISVAHSAPVLPPNITPRADPSLTGYLGVFFLGDKPSVYFYLSNGNNAISMKALNRGQPVIVPTKGTQGVRDPSIISGGGAEAGKKWYIIGTDLNIAKTTWDAAQRKGSRGIFVWESTDLINWTSERLVTVEDATAGMVWAPAAIWDAQKQQYLVHWASKFYTSSDTQHTGSPSAIRIRYAYTSDFKTFTAPQDYINKSPTNIIDLDILSLGNNAYARFMKDESAKTVFTEVSSNGLFGTWSRPGGATTTIASGVEGPAVYWDNQVDGKAHLLLDFYGGDGYKPYESTDVKSGRWTASSTSGWPKNLRHGSVLPITAAQMSAVGGKWPAVSNAPPVIINAWQLVLSPLNVPQPLIFNYQPRDTQSMDEEVRELHRDLASRYVQHGSRVEQMWRSLEKGPRINVLRAGAHNGALLKHSRDRSLGNVWKIMPEWNIEDLTAPSSNLLIEMLKHRATTSLLEQYASGINGGPGDHAHIIEMMEEKNLQHQNASHFKDCWTLFVHESTYGNSFEISSEGKLNNAIGGFLPGIEAQVIVPQDIGELILERQRYLLLSLIIVVEDILNASSTTRTQEKRPKPSADAATAALASLSLLSSPKKFDISDLVDITSDHKSALEDHITLISTEPTVLAYRVNFWFFSRPEMLPDEKGRSLTAHTDKHITGAFFDAVHDTVKTAATWDYIANLLELLKDSSSDKRFRAIVLQELSNVCRLEYLRAQAMFKRNVSIGSGGLKWFKRISMVRSDGIVRISMKQKPDSLTLTNPQLYYMLRLCLDETDWRQSAEWLQKLEDLHRGHPSEKEKMTEWEHQALGDLAIIVILIQSISSVVQLPTASNKKGQLFISNYSALDTEFRELKNGGLDLTDYAVPIDNLLEPGMAISALSALDKYFQEKTGAKLGAPYQDLVNECVPKVHESFAQRKMDANVASTAYIVPSAPESSTPRIQQPKQKEKTRPDGPSIYDVTPQSPTVVKTLIKQTPQQTFKVKASTLATFSTLLSRTSAARGSVPWAAFTTAMADVGFAIHPKIGSIFTFVPPEEMSVQRPLTLHRPHHADIEGPLLLVYSRRLMRVYGWSEATFMET
ncbi:unnamed protein product [Periconia digitata]|uniref:Uncharacterized protein n=1 Tax=Periconia digitata TaxID=1303443 RepID=A0A9W4U6Y4_9PLEO|nr:unnamed protein product [Periconia digitata]